jgi:hypothetical protein
MPAGIFGMPPNMPAVPPAPPRNSNAVRAFDKAMPLQPIPLRPDNSGSLIIKVATCWAISRTIISKTGAIAALGVGVNAIKTASVTAPKRATPVFMIDSKTCSSNRL